MIDFRYHVISIVAIFLALAVGIALGAGPLGAQLSESLLGQASRDRETVEAQQAELAAAERMDQFNDSFAAEVDTAVLDDLLTGTTVTVLALPGADRTAVEGVVEELQAAGADIVAEVDVTPALLDPTNRTTAQNLASQVLEGVEGVPTVEEAGSYEVVGYALGRGLLATTLSGAPVDGRSQEIQSAFEGAEYVTYEGGEVELRGGLAVVVAGPLENEDTGQTEVLAAMLDSMDSMSGGVVLAGPLESTPDSGFVSGVLASAAANNVSTVDVVDTVAGRIITVMALAEQAAQSSGHYGAGDGVDAVVPPLPTGDAL